VTVLVVTEDRLPADVSGVDCWLHAGPNAAWRLEAEAGVLRGIPRLDRADRLQEKASELRTPFLEWVGELGIRHACLEWWASQLASRASFNGFYERICLLAIALDALAERTDGTMLVVCSTPALAREVARAAATEPCYARPAPPAGGRRSLRVWARLAPPPLLPRPGLHSTETRQTLDSDPRYRRRILARHGLLERPPFAGPNTALLFTWIDERSFGPDGRYRDPHLGPLPRLLRDEGLEVALVARVLHALAFDDAVRRLAASGERFLFPDAFVQLDDRRDCALRAATFAPDIPDEASVAGIPVAGLARELVAGERPGQAEALSLEPLLRRMASAGVRPSRIVHTYEGHPWELVLAHAARAHMPETDVVGYENLNMSRLSLSMFSAPAELRVRPLPDRIVTNGPAFRDVLLAEGLSEGAVRVGCALRHEHLWKIESPRVTASRAGAPRRVVAAGEIALAPSAELIAKAAEAFSADPGYELLVKPHPLLPRARIERALGERAAGLHFVEEPMLELLASADLLLYSFSAVGFEALALGVPPVFVRSDSALDLDKLEFAGHLRWTARTPEQLRARAQEIAALSSDELGEWRNAARAAAQRALKPLCPRCVEAFL
jgi:hypothetical protein